jgi:hypothetical protein
MPFHLRLNARVIVGAVIAPLAAGGISLVRFLIDFSSETYSIIKAKRTPCACWKPAA